MSYVYSRLFKFLSTMPCTTTLRPKLLVGIASIGIFFVPAATAAHLNRLYITKVDKVEYMSINRVAK